MQCAVLKVRELGRSACALRFCFGQVSTPSLIPILYIREIREFREIREIREIKEIKEFKEFREFREFRDISLTTLNKQKNKTVLYSTTFSCEAGPSPPLAKGDLGGMLISKHNVGTTFQVAKDLQRIVTTKQ